jgi:hypothetical protein
MGGIADFAPLSRILAALVAVALCACVEFSGNKLPVVPTESLAKSEIDDVDYTLAVHFEDADNPDLVPIYSVVLGTEMGHVFANTHRGGSDAPLHLDVVLGCAPMSTANRIWLDFSALTATVIPVRREIVYTLRVRANWDGKPLKTYEYEDSLNRWIGIVFLPLMPTHRRTGKRELEIIRNMDANFLADLSKDLETLPAVTVPQ